MKNMRNGLKGLSFIEVLITVFIIGIIILGLVNVLSLYTDVFFFKTDERESISNLDMIMDRLARDIRQGRRVLAISTYTLTIELSTGVTHTYSLITGNDGKKYFGVDGQILAGPINEIVFSGRKDDLTYTTNAYDVRVVTFTITMADGRNMSSMIALRAEIPKVAGGVVITEIMYYPPDRDKNSNRTTPSNCQFVVLYNNSNSPVDLRGWSINGNAFSTLVSGTWTLYPGKSAVIGSSGSNLIGTYYFPLPQYATYIKTSSSGLGTGGNALPTWGTNTITIRDSLGNVIDQVSYSNTWGGYPKSTSGQYRDYYSLVRKSLMGSSQDPNNWGDSQNLNFVANQGKVDYVCYCLIPKLVITEVMYFPCPYVILGWSNTNQNECEYIEVHNPTYSSIDLTIDWSNNNAYCVYSTSTSNYIYYSTKWTLAPGDYAVVSSSAANIQQYYGLSSNIIYMKTNGQSLASPTYTNLPDTSFTITLLQRRSEYNTPNKAYTIDYFYYSPSLGGYPYTSYSLDRYYSIEIKNLGLLGLFRRGDNYVQNVSSSTKLCYSVFISWENNNQGKRYEVYCTPGTKNSVSP